MRNAKVIRVGIFYDGNFFFHVSTFYRYVHPPRKRISIGGLHEFIQEKISEFEEIDIRYVPIVTAHFFRGRLPAREADLEDKLYSERVFEDILMSEGIVTHYMPIRIKSERRHETGIDVWFALEAYEAVVHNKLDILVLITGDADFIPLIKKAHSAGVKVMILGWDFKYTDETGYEQSTLTSTELLNSATYPLRMYNIIEDGLKKEDPKILNLFIELKEEVKNIQTKTYYKGKIHSLKEGYGFISCPDFPNNVFFHYSALNNQNFQELYIGQAVEFLIRESDKGFIAQPVIIAEQSNERDSNSPME